MTVRGLKQRECLLVLVQVDVRAGSVSHVSAAGGQRETRIGRHPRGGIQGSSVVLGDHTNIRRLHRYLGRAERGLIIGADA